MGGLAGEGADDRWTLRAADRALLSNKSGATRPGFAVLFKLFQADGRFPRRPEDVPGAAVEAVAAQTPCRCLNSKASPSILSSSRAASATLRPCAAIYRASASSSPLDAPVTSATPCASSSPK